MRGPLDSLVRIRRLFFERTLADAARAASRVRGAREILDGKMKNQASIERKRDEVSNRLHVPQDARWLANLLAFDRRLAEDLTQACREVGQAESVLSGQLDSLSGSKGELAGARARLQVVLNLDRRRRRAASRRRERRAEVSGFRAPCL